MRINGALDSTETQQVLEWLSQILLRENAGIKIGWCSTSGELDSPLIQIQLNDPGLELMSWLRAKHRKPPAKLQPATRDEVQFDGYGDAKNPV